MKTLPFVPDVELMDIYGEPITAERANGSVVESLPVRHTHLRFLLERCADPTFAGSRTGADAIEFVCLARAEIRDQASAAKDRGHWLLEDDRAEASRRATLAPANGYRADIQHNWKPFTDAAKAMTDAPKE